MWSCSTPPLPGAAGLHMREAAERMTIRPIVRYPDPRLELPAQPVTAFDDALRELAGDLLETMHAAPGIGITAPHIGVPLRVVVLDLDPAEGARTYVNPEIIWASPEMILHREGSVSMPGVNDDVEPPCAGPDQLSGPRRQPEDRGIGRPARGLPPARDRSAQRPFLDQAAVPAQARAADQAL